MKDFCFISVVLLFFSLSLWAQEMPSINYTTHNGLPQIQVQKLFQDSRGYLWIGTKGGLARYNGESFKTYLVNQYITRIVETAQGVIYVSTKTGIYVFDKNQFKLIQSLKEMTNLMAGDYKYYLITHDSVKVYDTDNKFIESYSYKTMLSYYEDFSYLDTKLQTAFFINPFTDSVCFFKNDSLNTITIKGLYSIDQFENGQVFVKYYKDGRYYACDPFTKEVFYSYLYVNRSIEDVKVNQLPVNKHLLKHFYALQELDSTTLSAHKLEFPILKVAFDALLDKDENYWLGTDNGVYQIANNALEVFPRSYMNDVWTIIKGIDGNFYGGIFQKGLFKYNLEKQTTTELKTTGNPINSYETDYYYGATKDKAGNLYFPTQYGLVKHNYRNTYKLDKELTLISVYDSISNSVISGRENGISFFYSNDTKESVIDSTLNYIPTHPNDFEFMGDSIIWLASWQKLAFYNRHNKNFLSAEAVLGSNYPKGVVSLDKDRKENVWIGGTDGLWLYNQAPKTCEKIKPDIYNTFILDVKEINNKYLLIGTSRELYIVNLEKYYDQGIWEYKMFNYKNGFVGQEIAQNGFYVDQNKVYIPTTTNMCVLDLDKISFKPDFFNVQINTVNDIGLTNEQQKGKEIIKLPYKENEIIINYEAVGFGLPTTTKFQYLLEGVDEQWTNWTESNQAAYNSLKSGKYNFRIRALNGSHPGVPLVKESAINFKVTLPFYLSPDFYKYAFFVTILLGLIAAYFIWNTYQNRIKIQNTERQIKLLEIATLQAQINPHFIFNFLSSIQGIINKNAPDVANKYLVKFSRLMRKYMESSIKSTQILTGDSLGNENTIKEEIDLLETYLDLEKVKYPEGKLTHEIKYNSNNILHKTIPPMILQPFVENAIKHGILPKEGNGHISISFEIDDQNLICTIADNGIGRDLSEKMKQDAIKIRKSRGLELIKKRVEMLNQLDYNIHISFKDPETGGTIVYINITYKS